MENKGCSAGNGDIQHNALNVGEVHDMAQQRPTRPTQETLATVRPSGSNGPGTHVECGTLAFVQ